MKRVTVRKDSYFDSIFLMSLTRKLKEEAGVADAVVAMGTEMNIQLIRSQGYEGVEGAAPNDLIIAVECEGEEAVESALHAAENLLVKSRPGGGAGTAFQPTSLDGALEQLPGANLAVISVPGQYAAHETRRALERGLHVMLFSDNVSIEEEIALKQLGRSKGLLVMGPDCGTAIINGAPICFANAVARGPVGVVAASGTGLQEVTCLVDRLGAGISQAIGTGGRDLKDARVGGSTMLMGIEALARDDSTSVLAVVSKPPAPEVAAAVLGALGTTGKPAVVHFIGLDGALAGGVPANVELVESLEETAVRAVALATGTHADAVSVGITEEEVNDVAEREARRLAPEQKFVRGYYTGGTVADEALILLHRRIGGVYSNNQTDPAFTLQDPEISVEHTIVDLGDDTFTRGRPHPMIDPSTRNERIESEADDPTIAVVLVDVVLGHGSHGDPAGALLPSLLRAKRAAENRGGYLPVVASVIGTPRDPQGFAGQVAKLESAGCVVMPSNLRAALLAEKILEKAAEE
ncbi:acyl-CoA synthetase FdrA [Salinispira pacifica]